MAAITEFRLTISRTINLGNYESLKIEASATVGRDADADTPEAMRSVLLDEVHALLEEARHDHVPKRRAGAD